MDVQVVVIIILLSVVLDYIWFDHDGKRWGWMKHWTRRQKILFISSFFIAALVIYIGLSLEYL